MNNKRRERDTASGSILEMTVKSTLEKKGFRIISHTLWKKNPPRYGKELLLTNAPYKSIYAHPAKTEFLAISEKYNLRIRIECKWQQVAGSVDEKLPYLYLNTIEAMPEDHIIIIIDGGGWKTGSIPWLKDAIAKKKYTNEISSKKNIEVMDLKGFLTWVNQNLRS